MRSSCTPTHNVCAKVLFRWRREPETISFACPNLAGMDRREDRVGAVVKNVVRRLAFLDLPNGCPSRPNPGEECKRPTLVERKPSGRLGAIREKVQEAYAQTEPRRTAWNPPEGQHGASRDHVAARRWVLTEASPPLYRPVRDRGCMRMTIRSVRNVNEGDEGCERLSGRLYGRLGGVPRLGLPAPFERLTT
jgi:hypothetical protein